MIKLTKSHHSEDTSKKDNWHDLLPEDFIQEILKFFPIGQSIQHYHEYHNEDAENTVILAYCINKQFIYSMADIRLEDDKFILLDNHENPLSFKDIEHFYLIVPYVEHSQLEYVRTKTHLVDTPINNYSLGNSITLLSPSTELRCEPQLDSTVIRIMTLRDGIYAHNKVVALEPIIEGVEHVDRRVFQRVETDHAVEIAALKSKDFITARLQDFCEKTARVLFDDESFLAPFKLNDALKLMIPGDQNHLEFLLSADIVKLRPRECVICFTGIRKRRRFEDIENVDLLAIKASLLQHVKTRSVH